MTSDELANTAILRALIDEGVIVSSGFPHSWPRCDGMMECACPPLHWVIHPSYLKALREQGIKPTERMPPK